ncbi:MAG: 16S rRNA (cytosine(1402)-N(4))-methyltransferase RsmH [Chloroflexi bacterium]|nr:16S rRNA (cytosine(1402)-N(4))-methyltransferase RsmH [Chloroflexota bacterium]
MSPSQLTHIPVLLNEVLAGLQVRPGGRYVDATLGAGGHAQAILEICSPGGRLLGLDADPQAVALAQGRLEKFGPAATLVCRNFRELADVCQEHGFHPVDSILFDLGLSSLQLEAEERGFSFQREGPLDMRFGPDQELTAADIVNTYSELELTRLLETYGEEHQARLIARRFVRCRPLRTTLELAEAVAQATGGRHGRIHPATRTFQALRIAVNSELESLELALKQAPDLLREGGRLAVIAYHSLEDRPVKQFLRRTHSLRPVNKKVLRPSREEVMRNPRSRSARMRVAERVF